MPLKLNGTNSVAAPAYAGDDADTGLQCGTNELNLVTGGTARVKIASDGAVQLLSSTGIDFSGIQTNASGMSSEILDSYEEGTWTPTIGGVTTAGSYTYGANVGAYTKIGNQVTAHFNIQNIVVGTAGSGILKIAGLPFASQNTNAFYPHGSLRLSHTNVIDNIVSIACSTQNNTTELRVVETRDAASTTSVSVTDIANNDSADFIGSITYIVA